ncbi:MAG: 4-hydroxythreonine-4-phosphate dehydrogenase PdxA [Planctomycetes bacterium]|nr:4-hydroxythreonine-4-phosphate dehydrogenase PdxA [Planctomycetota bacterium]
MTESLPRIGITLGDPAGIGPEVAAKALADAEVLRLARFAVFGYPPLKWMELGGRAPSFITHSHPPEEWDGHMAGVELIHSGGDLPGLARGAPSREGGQAAVRCILAAIDAAKRGWIDAIVTGPISKEAVAMAGCPWPGHTELLAEKFGAADVAMMFVGGPFRVVLATIHVPLAEAIRTLSAERILRACRLAHAALRRWFGVPVPRLGVCGLNPHAGEAGRFGHEEREIIQPAIEQAEAEGIAAFGPLPPDTAFLQAARGRFDCIVAMYHDQGLIPVKTVAFHEAVNVTLGLPIVRTSVDHGTAYDIAGRGEADPGSMKAAIRLAADMVRRDRQAKE